MSSCPFLCCSAIAWYRWSTYASYTCLQLVPIGHDLREVVGKVLDRGDVVDLGLVCQKIKGLEANGIDIDVSCFRLSTFPRGGAVGVAGPPAEALGGQGAPWPGHVLGREEVAHRLI